MTTEVATSYQFYSDVYGGSLSEAAFYDCLPKALNHVKWLTSYRHPSGACETKKYKRAICAAVEAFANYGDGGFDIPAGSRIDFDGSSYYVTESSALETVQGQIHHWELKVK